MGRPKRISGGVRRSLRFRILHLFFITLVFALIGVWCRNVLTIQRAKRSLLAAGGAIRYSKDGAVEYIEVRDTEITSSLTRSMKVLGNVCFLNLEGSRISEDGWNYINTSPNLRGLALSNGSVQRLARKRSLDTLYLNNSRIRLADAKLIVRLGVSKLLVCYSDLSDEAICELLSRNLIDLKLISCTGFGGESLKSIGRCERLVSLEISDTAISDVALHYIGLSRVTKSIDLTRTLISDDGIGMLRNKRNVGWLVLNKTQVSDRAIESLAELGVPGHP